MPGGLLRDLIRWHLAGGGGRQVPDCCVEATARLLNPRAVRSSLCMARSELDTVNQMDYDKLKAVADNSW